MDHYEKLKEELEDVEYSIDNLDGIITALSSYKEDCKDIVTDLRGNMKELEYIANEIGMEIDEIETKLISERDNELWAMNYEFERSGI